MIHSPLVMRVKSHLNHRSHLVGTSNSIVLIPSFDLRSFIIHLRFDIVSMIAHDNQSSTVMTTFSIGSCFHFWQSQSEDIFIMPSTEKFVKPNGRENAARFSIVYRIVTNKERLPRQGSNISCFLQKRLQEPAGFATIEIHRN